MQVKVFEAKDMRSGLKLVKEALGPEALILSSRTVRKGRFGIGGPPSIEITAASDTTQGVTIDEVPVSERQLLYSKPIRQVEQDIAPVRKERTLNSSDRAVASSTADTEINELRNLIQGLSEKLHNLEHAPPAGLQPRSAQLATGTYGPVTTFLLSRGVNQEAARMVERFTGDLFSDDTVDTQHRLNDLLTRTMARLFSVKPLLQEKVRQQQRLCCVGPTGAGKTTTIAKLAANYLSRFAGKVVLLTIDTYRIAAVEQLKVYGEIMRIPVEVIISPDELALALEKYHDYDLILIDTAGRSPRNDLEIEEMVRFLPPALNIEHHLLLPAPARENELEATIRTFSVLPLSSFIFTKIDECSQLGVLLNIHFRTDIPISFLTDGQRVPEDIIAPDPQQLADFIINDHRTVTHG
ncbi:MAG: flagellar biosynthesis protein FlhF [Desulfobulbus propionicus]|nr:MAG: flagellar biosynthesis protein FlhF [Desulfobulbus propionicus]